MTSWLSFSSWSNALPSGLVSGGGRINDCPVSSNSFICIVAISSGSTFSSSFAMRVSEFSVFVSKNSWISGFSHVSVFDSEGSTSKVTDCGGCESVICVGRGAEG